MLRIQTILFPTDFSSTADHALQVARSLARDHQAKLVLLNAVMSAPAVEMYVPEMDLDSLSKEAQRHLEEVAARITDVPVETIVHYGEPGGSIVVVAERVGADLIVVGTHGRSGVGRMLLGSVAEYVLRHAPCPVLTIKPGTEQHLQDTDAPPAAP